MIHTPLFTNLKVAEVELNNNMVTIKIHKTDGKTPILWCTFLYQYLELF